MLPQISHTSVAIANADVLEDELELVLENVVEVVFLVVLCSEVLGVDEGLLSFESTVGSPSLPMVTLA